MFWIALPLISITERFSERRGYQRRNSHTGNLQSGICLLQAAGGSQQAGCAAAGNRGRKERGDGRKGYRHQCASECGGEDFPDSGSDGSSEEKIRSASESGKEADLNSIFEDIKERDYQDTHRKLNPLQQAEDAVLMDTSDMTIDQVLDEIMKMAEGKNE